MSCQVEHFDNAFPHRLPLKNFLHWNTFNVHSFRAMHAPDYVSQFCQIVHDANSTKSPTLNKSRSIPAAIAGVQAQRTVTANEGVIREVQGDCRGK
jgi:hypothetical protein